MDMFCSHNHYHHEFGQNHDRHGGPSNPLCRRCPFASLAKMENCPIQFPANYETEDARLANWQKWIKIREKLSMKFEKLTHRRALEFAMNSEDAARAVNERKMVSEYAKVYKKATVRGCPWDQPPRLSQKSWNDPVYEIQPKLLDRGIVSTIERIKVPDRVKEELGVFGQVRRKTNKGVQQEKDMESKMRKEEKHKPQINTLMIEGFRPRPKPLPIKIPVVTVTNAPDEAECDALDGIYALRINNTILTWPDPANAELEAIKREPWHEETSSWYYVYNATTLRLACKLLAVRNLGTVTIRYCWHQIEAKIQGIPDAHRYPIFFFCKNNGILLPGQEHRIKIWFVSEEPGYFLETWELKICNVNFYSKQEKIKFIFHLRGYAFEEDLGEDRRDEMRDYIAARAKTFIINSVLEYLLNKIFKNLPEPYPYKRLFLDSDLFEMKNRVCFFHQTEVDNLTVLHSKLRDFDEDVPWDYKVESIRNALLREEYPQGLEYYGQFKESFAKLLRPFSNNDDLACKKYRASKLLLNKFVNLFETESVRLNHLLRSSDAVISRFGNRHDYKLTFFTTMGGHFADTVEAVVAALQSISVYDHLIFT